MQSVMKKGVLWVLFCLVFIPVFATATVESMTLLAVAESEEGFVGSEASLRLETHPGSGRVFLETQPFSKLDTQISTRLAHDIACDYISVDCSNTDFFYTITADTTIIGGPSAGAAIALLTTSALTGFDLDQEASITGTINSGGLVGAVGGIKEKIDAASSAGITTVLIPRGESIIENKNFQVSINETAVAELNESGAPFNAVVYGESIGVSVIEVNDINDAFTIMTGNQLKSTSGTIERDEAYVMTMKQLASSLCDRASELKKLTKNMKSSSSSFSDALEFASNTSAKAEVAILTNDYYSGASFCFGANVHYTYAKLLSDHERGMLDVQFLFEKLERDINETATNIDRQSVSSLTDLQTKVIVEDRLQDARQYATNALEKYNETVNEEVLLNLAFARERLRSVVSWSAFFNYPSDDSVINDKIIQKGCVKRYAEAEQRFRYAQFLSASLITGDMTEKLKVVEEAKSAGDFDTCLFSASQLKAEIDLLLSVIGLRSEQIANLTSAKLSVAERAIAEQQEAGRFPILGYSYYEYSHSLQDSDAYSALLYASYALELSDLDPYVGTSLSQPVSEQEQDDSLLLFGSGFVAGLLVLLVLQTIFRSKKFRRKK